MEDQCILISNGRVIDPQNGIEESRDIFIEQGRVQAVVNPGELKIDGSVTRIEAKGLLVMPGLIDMHVHLREPGYEWKETVASGARAAIAGGFTSICCMPNTNPANDCAEITDFIIRRAKAAGAARVFPVGAVTVGREGRKMAPLSELAKAGCVGFSDDGDPIFDAGLMRRALEWSRMVGLPIMCHEEEKTLAHGGCMNESALSMRLGLKGIPCVAEDVMVARDIELARVTGARVHFCHISSARSVELIRRAKNDGIPVSAEVAPHHLMLSEQAVASYCLLT